MDDKMVWYVVGPGDIRPARVVIGDPDDRGSLNLIVLFGMIASTHNESMEDVESGRRWTGPPQIVVEEGIPVEDGGEPQEEETHNSVPYDPNGADGTWHEP